jgi:geranylgeranyl pyrophosphate synthase
MVQISDIAMEFCRRGGKRLRPRLCKAVYLLAGGVPNSNRIDVICDAVECFHKASLIHDDIQDCDEERYGHPTVWKEYNLPIAIAAGDWLVAHGYQLIASSGFSNALDMIEATVKSHVALCEGQGDDLIKGTVNVDADYLSICERKTGEAFALAAQLGALAAGADSAAYRRYGLDFGVLFQLRDDLADDQAPEGVRELAEKLEKELFSTDISCKLGEWFKSDEC